MTADETHKLIDEHIKDPVLKTWKPSDYELRHKYKPTPKGQAKLAADKAKFDAELKAEYDRAVSEKARVHAVIDEIAKWPTGISNMLLPVFRHAADSIVRTHSEYVAALDAFKSEYGEFAYDRRREISEIGSLRSYKTRGYGSTVTLVKPSKEKWDEAAARYYDTVRNPETGYYERVYPLKSIVDWERCYAAARRIAEIKAVDPVVKSGPGVFEETFKRLADKFSDMCEEVKKEFAGRIPDGCSDPHFGAKGEFAGILSESVSGKKISFCSFSAGGWNIVRFHYRYKITPLKA